jgi:3,4-dihydroxy 2-butanone 4-phosphate synthase/GTP cyclohydrolase II
VEYGEPVMTRINSTLVNNDILGTLTNDADKKLDNMFHLINKENRVLFFINQEVTVH